MFELSNISKTYEIGATEVQALRGVSLTIEDGEYVAIMGPSGSGKSTLMHVLGLLDVPTSGSYRIDGREVSGLTEDELAVLRRDKIGFVFQQFNLLPRMSAAANVALPLLYSRGSMHLAPAAESLKQVGLADRAVHHPNELSGGQQQRVAIARALINRPTVVLADEPTGNLDSASQKEILGILGELNRQGITVVIVTHDEEIARHTQRIVRMRDGRIVSDDRNGERKAAGAAELRNTGSSGTRHPIREGLTYLKQGLDTLVANKVRTALSVLGILIGVAAVVAMLALGSGAQKAIEAQLASLGSNLLVLRSGAVRVAGVSQETGSRARITEEDVAAILEKIPPVKLVSPNVSGRAQVNFEGQNWSTQVLGTTPEHVSIRAAQPQLGRFFTDDENRKRARVVVLGTRVVRELFGNRDPLGEQIKVNRVIFQVVGVLPEKGATGFRDQDDVIIIPLSTAMYRLLGKTYVDYVDIEIHEASMIEDAEKSILDLMHTRHQIALSQRQGAFEIRNMADIQEAFAESSRTMSLLLSSIAAISLLVGGIGIMNIMLVSVTERTREVGLRKAVGAKRRDILSQFLAESVVVSATGGLCGILLGWLITEILGAVADWSTSISLGSVLLAFFFSAFIGIIFGIYPARKAALLNPIDALRYE